eukprot:8475502-Pyramimonas_sp.AAC.1
MHVRAQSWINKWSRRSNDHELHAAFQEVRKCALEAPPLPPLELARLDLILQRTPERKSRGCVNISARDIARLPPAARQELLDVYQAMENNIAWPWQMLRAWIALLPKDSGADRSIASFAFVARLWEQLRGDVTDQWSLERQRRARFDDAVKGSSAVQAALKRLVLDESAATFKVSTCSALCDIETFYDSLDPVLVMQLATKHNYPCIVLALSIQLHLAPRYLRSLRSFSPAIEALWGLLAGCRSAQHLAACMLFDLMFDLNSRFQPGLEARTWVDDVNSRAEGTAKNVTNQT